MKYKEFKKWCNDRACDGCWGMTTAMICCSIISDINEEPFWKREKKWKEIENEIVTNIVEPIEKKIVELQQQSAC